MSVDWRPGESRRESPNVSKSGDRAKSVLRVAAHAGIRTAKRLTSEASTPAWPNPSRAAKYPPPMPAELALVPDPTTSADGTTLPLVGVPACRKTIDPHPYHCVGEKYLGALRSAAGCVPLVVPALGEQLERSTLLASLDGLLFTGSHSNVEPHHYGERLQKVQTLADPHRDATTIPMIRAAVTAGVPLLAICRGFQEVNVAFGGALHQHVEEQPGLMDHREDTSLPLEQRYAPVHDVSLVTGGQLAALAGATHAQVNSLHGQGIKRLADGLEIEATAPDGLVEAVRVRAASNFALAVQWHPEWRPLEHPLYSAIFAAFGAACRARAESRRALLSAVTRPT